MDFFSIGLVQDRRVVILLTYRVQDLSTQVLELLLAYYILRERSLDRLSLARHPGLLNLRVVFLLVLVFDHLFDLFYHLVWVLL